MTTGHREEVADQEVFAATADQQARQRVAPDDLPKGPGVPARVQQDRPGRHPSPCAAGSPASCTGSSRPGPDMRQPGAVAGLALGMAARDEYCGLWITSVKIRREGAS